MRRSSSFARALPVLRERAESHRRGRGAHDVGDVEVERSDADAALPRVDEALRLARLVANPGAEQAALYVRALALRQQGRVDEAIDSIAAATRGVEAMRGAMRRSELQTSYLARVRRYFDLQIDLLQQKGDLAAAFETAERSRARTLLDGLAESASRSARASIRPCSCASARCRRS